MTEPKLFVSGGNGQLGRLVVEHLRQSGHAGRLIVGSRRPAALELDGIETRTADFGDAAGFAAALEGVDRLLLISVDVLGDERNRLHGAAVAAAKAAGVRHVVYTSMPHPEVGNPAPMAAGHLFTERAIEASGMDYTILRTSWYAENLLGALPQALASGKWFTASGQGRISYITRFDVARAAAAALGADFDGRRVMTITGTAAHTVPEIAAIASALTNRPIEVVDLPDAQYEAGLVQAGLPPDVAALLTSLERLQRMGGLSMVTDAVEALTGSPATSLDAFLAAHRAALAAD